MHMAWMRAVCGRLKSDYQYSPGIVYNNFPWFDLAQMTHITAIEAAAKKVLAVRDLSPKSSLADLYDPVAMPPELQEAHQVLDKCVDSAYGYKGNKDDTGRAAFLFNLYHTYTSLLPAERAPKRARSKN